MARIIYGVAGEGNGHAIRAKIIIDELKKDHEITAFSYGKNWWSLRSYFQQKKTVNPPLNPTIKRIVGSYMYYINNTVSATITTTINIIKLPVMLLASLRYIPHFIIPKLKPDVVMTDFEPFVGYWSLLFNVPVISIDNQHAITHTSIDKIKGQFLYELYSKFVVKSFVPKANKVVITSFFNAERKNKHKTNTTLVKPIVKSSIQKQKRTNKGHVLVYQTSASYTHMLPILKKINKEFIIYGFNKNEKDHNLIFKKFNGDGFNKDIASADAVIINGGFTVLSEALYLHKPIFSIPIKQQFEQILNGHYINKMAYGVAVKDITENNFSEFLDNTEIYRHNIKKIKWDKNEEFFSVLNGAIEELSKS
jgi:uncharacterized protein (TIGR00661 family)